MRGSCGPFGGRADGDPVRCWVGVLVLRLRECCKMSWRLVGWPLAVGVSRVQTGGLQVDVRGRGGFGRRGPPPSTPRSWPACSAPSTPKRSPRTDRRRERPPSAGRRIDDRSGGEAASHRWPCRPLARRRRCHPDPRPLARAQAAGPRPSPTSPRSWTSLTSTPSTARSSGASAARTPLPRAPRMECGSGKEPARPRSRRPAAFLGRTPPGMRSRRAPARRPEGLPLPVSFGRLHEHGTVASSYECTS